MINNSYDEFEDFEDYDEENEDEETADTHEVRISYAQYKNEYPQYQIKEHSYDEDDRTIIVYFPVGENPKPFDSSKYKKKSNNNKKKSGSDSKSKDSYGTSNYQLHKDIEELKDCINSNFQKLFEMLEER